MTVHYKSKSASKPDSRACKGPQQKKKRPKSQQPTSRTFGESRSERGWEMDFHGGQPVLLDSKIVFQGK